MTQSRAKQDPDRRKQDSFDEAFKLLDQCTSEELITLSAEIKQILWERQIVAEADATPGASIPAEEVFAVLTKRFENKKA